MNEYIGENGITFGGPNFTDVFTPEDHEKYYRDTPLSPTGQEQAKKLGETVASLLQGEHCLQELELVVVSPLTRAIQTAELALFPHVEASIPVMALPLAAERLYLVSDIGRPPEELKKKHGDKIDFQTGFSDSTTDPWWYHPPSSSSSKEEEEWRPVGQGQAYFCAGEPLEAFQQRMLDLCHWLKDRPESTIALVGHYGVFEWLLEEADQAEKVKFSNCEMKVVELETILANAQRRSNQ